jgi:hypothetical protein
MADNSNQVVFQSINQSVKDKQRLELIRNDEIEILEIVVRFFRILKRHRLIMLASIILGPIAGIIWFQSITPLYKFDLILSVPHLSKQEISLIVSGVPQRNHITSVVINNDDKDPYAVAFSVITDDASQFDGIKESIAGHVRKNQFVEDFSRKEFSALTKTIAELTNEEAKIESVVKSIMTTPRSTLENTSSLAELVRLKTEFFKERISLENQLQNFSPLTIVEANSLERNVGPYNKDLFRSVAIASGISIILGTLIMGTLELFAAMRDHEEENKLAVSLSSLSLRNSSAKEEH